jgi:pilus assembly protein CpaC
MRSAEIICGRSVRWAVLFGGLLFANSAAAQDRAPAPAAVQSRVNDLIVGIREAEVELKITLRRSKILQMKRDIVRVAIADPDTIEFVAFGPREIEIIGREPGSTTLTLWLEPPPGAADPEASTLLSILVTVLPDEGAEDRRRLEYGELQTMLNELFPNSKLLLIPIADKLIVRGQARDEQEAVQIMSIIRQRGAATAGTAQGAGFTDGVGGAGYGVGQAGFAGVGAGVVQGTAASPFPDSPLPPSNVISMLEVPGEKQVLLKVRIAELSRSAVRRLGVDFDFNVGEFFVSSMLGGAGNILTSGSVDGNAFNLILNALAAQGTARILAEPNLVVLSGQTASFIAGGEFAVPTVVGVGGVEAVTTHFKGFGTQLMFTPTVLDRDRVRLVVAPTFSTLNAAAAVQGIPGLDTRSVNTTVDLREGQTLAIAGLLQEQQRGDLATVPFFSDLPVVRQLFMNREVTRDEKELIILVSPELVHPMEPEQAPLILPGMEVTEPDDIEFFLKGRIEGRPDCTHRSTVWPLYRSRLGEGRFSAQRRAAQKYYLHGPHGFSD